MWQWLTNLVGVGDEWISWLRLHRTVSATEAELLAVMIDLAPESGSTEELISELKRPARTVREQLARAGLPKAERLYTGSRLLNALLQLQRDHSLTGRSVARQLGYADYASFSGLVYAHFGMGADVSRRLLGLEWRFAAWWERAQRAANRRAPHMPGSEFDRHRRHDGPVGPAGLVPADDPAAEGAT